MRRGFFVTIEGPDGSGKSTQSKLLVRYLCRKGWDVVHTREPGGTLFTEFLRKILLKPESRISPLTELLLYTASRAQHTIELIKPALQDNKIVVCERYTDATTAYQGYGRKLSLKLIKQLNNIATGGLKPDITLLLDIDVEKGLSKIKKGKRDRLEKEGLSFHRRLRRGYLSIAKKEHGRVKIVNTANTIMETHKNIVKIIDKFLSDPHV